MTHVATCAACQAKLEALDAPPALANAAGWPNTVTVPLVAPAVQPRRPPEEAAARELARGTAIGRYTVLELVGRGGMGEVYAAYDPQLDRKIALKLLRGATAPQRPTAEARLLREAKAIAKVSHPNVVTVHDAGTFGERIFVAMEFVEGGTLRDWLAAAPRSRAEILDVFTAAARGLAAAHAAGLVHRDFKPMNVMVGREGGVRVTDFGLVRQLAQGEDAPLGAERDAAAAGGSDEAEVDLTRTGEMVGTPRYMSPEQFKAGRIDARTDQFSFCVALYEALYGQPPFAGATLPQLMANVLAGRVAAAAAKTSVPGWLRRVLLRGLDRDPAGRYASMNALIAALGVDPRARVRRVALAAAALGCVALVGVGARQLGSTGASLCRAGGARWAAVWPADAAPSPAKDAIHRAFAATGKSYAEQAFAGVTHGLDEYVRRWIDMYTDTCEATHARGEQSAEVLDLRMACLQERFTSARALTEVLAHTDATVVENGVQAVSGLPTFDRCADVGRLRAVAPAPEDEPGRRRIEELRTELARLRATRDAGRCIDAERMAETLIPRARAAGYGPLLADVLNVSAKLSDACIEFPVARARWDEALEAGLASHQDESAAEAAVLLAAYEADRAKNTVEARRLVGIGRALLRRLGPEPLLAAWALVSEQIVLIEEGRASEAVAVGERAIHEKEALLGPNDPDVARSLNMQGAALHLAGRDDDALAAYERAKRIAARALGRDHPQYAIYEENEAELLFDMRRYDEALRAFDASRAVWRAAGAAPLTLAFALNGAGETLVELAQEKKAIPLLEEALASREKGSAIAPLRAQTRFALARALWIDPSTRSRSLALARAARRELESGAKPGNRSELGALDGWLAEREPARARQR